MRSLGWGASPKDVLSDALYEMSVLNVDDLCGSSRTRAGVGGHEDRLGDRVRRCGHGVHRPCQRRAIGDARRARASRSAAASRMPSLWPRGVGRSGRAFEFGRSVRRLLPEADHLLGTYLGEIISQELHGEVDATLLERAGVRCDGNPLLLINVTNVLYTRGDYAAGIAIIDRNESGGELPSSAFLNAALLYACAGNGGRARDFARRAATSGDAGAPMIEPAVLVAEGDHAAAIEELGRIRASGYNQFHLWRNDICFAPLRGEPSFGALFARVGRSDEGRCCGSCNYEVGNKAWVKAVMADVRVKEPGGMSHEEMRRRQTSALRDGKCGFEP